MSNPWDEHTALPCCLDDMKICGNDSILAEITPEDWPTKEDAANAAYIVEACNAYPELRRKAAMADELAVMLDDTLPLALIGRSGVPYGREESKVIIERIGALLTKYREGQS